MTTTNGASGALARKDDNFFSDETIALIRRTLVPDASEDEFLMLMEVARIRRLNPFLKQIHFVKRSTWDPETRTKSDRWAFQVAIDGFRLIAERTGVYDGQDEPEFELAPDGVSIVRCRVKIWRTDKTRPFVGIADWTEFVQKKSGGEITAMWRDKPRLMLAKCAEAMGFRKAFPEDTSGFYLEEEITKGRDEMQGEVVPTLGGSVAGRRAAPVVESPMLASAEASKAAAAELLKALGEQETRAQVLKIGSTIEEQAMAGRLRIEDRATCLAGYAEALKRVAGKKAPASSPSPASSNGAVKETIS